MKIKYKYKPNPDLATSTWVTMDITDDIHLFTGMVDADGQEIYDGDILIDSAGGYCYVDYSTLVGAFVMVKSKFIITFDVNILQQLRVVGNIYDDKELVKDFIDKRRLNGKTFGM